MLVERAPLPPHERSWRHPSEVGPTRRDVLEHDDHGRPLMLAVGTAAALLLVVMVVALTPRPGDGPSAISATTTPAGEQTTAVPRAAAAPRVISANTIPRLASFVPIPNAIASVPDGRDSTIAVAASLPDPDEPVMVRTDQVTYRIRWSDVAYLDVGDGAVVLDQDGRLVARVESDGIVVLADE